MSDGQQPQEAAPNYDLPKPAKLVCDWHKLASIVFSVILVLASAILGEGIGRIVAIGFVGLGLGIYWIWILVQHFLLREIGDVEKSVGAKPGHFSKDDRQQTLGLLYKFKTIVIGLVVFSVICVLAFLWITVPPYIYASSPESVG